MATLTVQLLHSQVWPTRAATRLAIFEYIEAWYNRQCHHSTLAYGALVQETAVA